MSAYVRRKQGSSLIGDLRRGARALANQLPSQRNIVFGMIILLALVAFETFNFSTTEFALADLFGQFTFAGMSWATILALAFCSIDFAGIARLMTPERPAGEGSELWYLLGAWFLGATMNAMLTWWAVSLALLGHAGLGNEVLGREALISGVPVFIAALVWLIRVLLIGTLTLAGHRLFGFGSQRRSQPANRTQGAGPTSANGAKQGPSRHPNGRTIREPRYVHEPSIAQARRVR